MQECGLHTLILTLGFEDQALYAVFKAENYRYQIIGVES